MRYKSNLLASFFLLLSCFTFSQSNPCNSNESEVIISIIPDNYPNETSWSLYANNVEVVSGTSNSDTLCVDADACLEFIINDSYGDGICCGYGEGSYTIFFEGIAVASGGEFTSTESHQFNCPPGTICNDPFMATTGNLNAVLPYSFYEFTPDSTGMYSLSTCGSSTCDTKIWIYDNCNSYVYNNDNTGTLFYNDDNDECNLLADIDAYLFADSTYIIKVGLNENSTCPSFSIGFDIIFDGPLQGCMDPQACNYEPNATVQGDCYYYPDPNCPSGPDLMILENVIQNSLNLRTEEATPCMVEEGCMNGYGERTVLAFDTWIKNIGDLDYYIGNPQSNPDQFSFDNCHGHAHYEGYAEYVLYTLDGQPIPIGHKNGFCVMDLECSDGGTAQYGCGNMGITKQCGDIYGSYLDCQWIDITNVSPGQYILAVKVNWDQSPDALGNYESTYDNNWGQVCIEITENSLGEQGFQLLTECDPYVDCNGVAYGNATIDCEGDCGGSAIRGDLDNDETVSENDALLYLNHTVENNLSANNCNDLSGDGFVNIWDAALANNCSLNGAPNNTECIFPKNLQNLNQIGIIGNIEIYNELGDPTTGYMNVYLKNIQNEISAYELVVTGATVTGASSLISNDFPFTIDYSSTTGKVAALSFVDSLIPKYTDFTPMLRIELDDIGIENNICLEVFYLLNDQMQPTTFAVQNNCLSTLSIDVASTIDFTAYPNPTNDLLTVTLPELTENIFIELYDLRGVKVKSIEVIKGTHEIKTSTKNLSNGIYRLVLNGDQTHATKAISVKH